MIYAIAVVLVLILDQAVKYWTNVNLEIDQVKELIPGFIELTNKRNPGAAWGLFENGRWLFVVLTVVACIVIILALRNDYIKGKLGRWMLVLVMAGGLGNFIDRLIYGYVVDMLHFQFVDFPVFNVADIFISVCGIIFCIWLIFHRSDEMEAHMGPEHESVHKTVGIRTDSLPRTGSHEAQQPGSDYITQLKRPVTQTRAMLERERLEEQRRREDPFAEFYSTPPAGSQPAQRPQAQPAQQAQPARQPRPAAPQPQARPSAPAPAASRAPQPQARAYNPPPAAPAPAPATAPKKSSTEFTLEDILSEFSDK